MNTSHVMISTTLVPGKFVLVIPVSQSALDSDTVTVNCIESYHYAQTRCEEITIIILFDSACKCLIITNATCSSCQ